MPLQSALVLISNAKVAADVLAPRFSGLQAEAVVTLYLGADLRLIEMTEGEAGTGVDVELPIRTIFADALRLSAKGFIVAHNHPSGDPTPSNADIHATRILAEIASRLGVVLYDHLVFGRGGDCRSLKALGLLQSA